MGAAFVTLQAEADLAQIWLYLAQESVESADRLLIRFENGFQQLADHPELGELIARFPLTFRVFTIGQYVVAYRPTVAGVNILRVMHGARNWEALLGGTQSPQE